MAVTLDVIYGERNALGVHTLHGWVFAAEGPETATPWPPVPGLARSRALEASVGLTCSLCTCVCP